MNKDELQDVLEEVGLEPKIDGSKNNFIICCPQCGQKECSISIDKKYHPFGCFRKKRCGFTGTLYDILKIHNKLHLLFKGKFIDRTENLPKLFEQVEETEIEDLPNVKLPLGYKRIYDDDLLKERGLIDFNFNEVGRSKIDPKFRNYYIFPVKENGEIKGLVGRHCWTSDKIKRYNEQYYQEYGLKNKIKRYINSLSEFSKLVYGLDHLNENTKTLIIVEGIFDYIKTNSVFIEDDPHLKCIATFKCNVSEQQLKKIKSKAPNIQTVILLYDPDVISYIKTNAFKLENHFNNVLIGFCDNGKDPGEMNLDDFERVFNSLESPLTFSKSYVALNTLL